jgi:hypothetical protein
MTDQFLDEYGQFYPELRLLRDIIAARSALIDQQPEPPVSAFAGRELHAIETITIPADHRDCVAYRNFAWRWIERRHRAALLLAGKQPAFDAPVIINSLTGEAYE